MIQLIFVNQTKKRLPRTWLTQWLNAVVEQLPLKVRRALEHSELELTLVFLPLKAAKKLNAQYRDRPYATDVLSFPGDGVEALGDLVFCPEVLIRQAKEHQMSFQAELGYMVLHGLLHLLGYDHEGSKAEAQKMYRLQDRIFHQLRHLHKKD